MTRASRASRFALILCAFLPLGAFAQSKGLEIDIVGGNAAALPIAHHSVFAEEPIFEYDRSSHPFRQQLVAEPAVQRDGWIDVPTGPGLGVEVVRSVLERYRV